MCAPSRFAGAIVALWVRASGTSARAEVAAVYYYNALGALTPLDQAQGEVPGAA
jgi:hypothetical protein